MVISSLLYCYRYVNKLLLILYFLCIVYLEWAERVLIVRDAYFPTQLATVGDCSSFSFEFLMLFVRFCSIGSRWCAL